MRIRKNIEYSIFLECIPYTTNTFWEYIFKDLAYGICPQGVFLTDGYLSCKMKAIVYYFLDKNIKDIYEYIFNFFNKELKLISLLDKFEEKKTTKFRSIHVENYILKKNNNLSIQQKKRLLNLININLQFKTITTNNIIYDEQKKCIKNINLKQIK